MRDPTGQPFEQVVSRFDNFLYRREQWKLQKGPRRFVDQGLLVLDRDPSTESAIDAMFKTFRDHGHSFGKLRHVIDVPFFASSEKVSGLQLADVCAYVVKRYLSTGAKPGSHEKRQFQRLFPRFDRDIYGKLHGVRHYVTRGACSCLICRDRGHDGGASAAAAPPEGA